MRRIVAVAAALAVGACRCSSSDDADRLAPAAPAIGFPAGGALLGAADAPGGLVTVSGTAEAGAVVQVTVGGTARTATRDGLAFTASFALADGSHLVTATASDAAGNVSAPATAAFELDATAPGAPAFDAPAPGATLNASAAPGGLVTLSGTTEPGTSVVVLVAGTPRTAAVAGGTWSLEVVAGEGLQAVAATARDAAGNDSAPANLTFTVDTTPPALAVTSPAHGALVGGAAAPSGAVTFGGTAEPDAVVTVSVGGTDRAAARTGGTWSATVTLADGPHAATVTAADAAGNPAVPASISFTLDATAPAAPDLATLASPTNLATVAVSGGAEALAVVRVLDDAVLAGTVTASAGGAFALVVPVASGSHAFTATASDAAGNVSPPSAPVTVVVDRNPPAAPSIHLPGEGATLRLANLLAFEVPIAGAAEPATAVTLELDGAIVATTAAAGDGAWFTTAPLGAGVHVLRARAADGVANVGDWSAPRTFTVDLPRTATALASPLPVPVTTWAQTVPDLAGEPGGEVFPGQANTWVLDPGFGLAEGWGLQYASALQLYVGATAAPATHEGVLAAVMGAPGTLRAFPYDQRAPEVTFLSPRFEEADGVRTALASDGFATKIPPIAGTRSAHLNGTSRSALSRALTLPPGAFFTFRWSQEVVLAEGLLPGAAAPPYGPAWQVVLRDAGTGAALGDPLYATSSSAVLEDFAVTRSGLPAGVVLSFELRSAAGGYGLVDGVSVEVDGVPVALPGGDFEGGLDGWTVPGAEESQNVRSAPREVGPAGSRLQVTRSVYAPPAATWARLVDVFENPGASAVATQAVYYTNLAAGVDARAAVPSPGVVVGWDAETADTALRARDLGLVVGSGTALVAPGSPFVLVVHDLLVPPGGRVALAQYVVQLGEAAGGPGASDLPPGTAAECAAIVAGWRDVYAYTQDLEPGVLPAISNF